MLKYEQKTLADKIAFIQSNDFCMAVVNSPPFDLDEVCEGDCDYCRTIHLNRLLQDVYQRLKSLAVPFDNNIRYKMDKKTFDEILEYLKCE